VVLLGRQCLRVLTSMVGRILAHLKAREVLKEPPRNRIKGSGRLKPRPYGVRKLKNYQMRKPGNLIQLDTLDIQPLPAVSLKHFTAQDVVYH
jgi:putative transposase